MRKLEVAAVQFVPRQVEMITHPYGTVGFVPLLS